MASEKFRIKQIPKENRKHDIWSRRAYVDWVNDKLKAHYTNALEFRNGALYIQLLDSIFPGAVPMNDVKFSAHMEYDCYQNFRILEEAFKKLGIDKDVDTHALSAGRHVESWAFLKWFKLFYDNNFDGKDYDPIKARKNAYMGFGKNTKCVKCAQQNRKTRIGKLPSHARSKSMMFQREEDGYDKKGVKKAEKICRSVECMQSMRKSEITRETPENLKKCGNERSNSKSKLKYIKLLQDNESAKENSYSNVSTSTNMASDEKFESESMSEDVVLVRKGQSHGDFEPKFSENIRGPQSSPTQGNNVNAIVVNKSQTYEDFGVRITENIQIRVESATNVSVNGNDPKDTERHRNITLMIEKFLKYQWIERKEYFQTLAQFIRDEEKNANN